MRTLTAWIVGIFALGLGLGSFVSSSAAVPEPEPELTAALDTAPLVDCGDGREALLEPVVIDGKTSFKVRCVRTVEIDEPETPSVAARAPAQTPAPAPAERSEPAPASVPTPTTADVDDERSWKESAVVIGGAAGTGTVIGAIAKGKKGAAVGAAIGAATGAAYELIKKDGKNK